MALSYATALRDAQQEVIRTFSTNAANSGQLRIYSGTQPASANAAIGSAGTNTLLGTLTMNATAFLASSAGVLVANAITQDTAADATGTATFFRLLNAAGTVTIMDGTISDTAGSGDMKLNTTSIVINGPITCTQFQITRGNP